MDGKYNPESFGVVMSSETKIRSLSFSIGVGRTGILGEGRFTFSGFDVCSEKGKTGVRRRQRPTP